MFRSLRKVFHRGHSIAAPKRRETALLLETLEDRALPSSCRFCWSPPKCSSFSPPKSWSSSSSGKISLVGVLGSVAGKVHGVQQITVNVNYITIYEITNINQSGKHDTASVTNTATTGTQSNIPLQSNTGPIS
jgi:hypothetical protein